MRPSTPDDVVAALRRVDQQRFAGRPLAEILGGLGVSLSTYYRWRRRFDGLRGADVARVRDLERENARLRRIVADSALEIEALREISRGGW